ncbi:lipopolysaccharide biosynthesis protein [Gordonia crocea]|uniref:Polysaccharide biosynthesis protein n=1 Tax=Gordonia crocea TaxID=589162 RepID=A0A7I9V0A8_9ACTN|nr:hypothetical protein [Gordonia crocea]GED98561.1 hypothetical protein nbrc107697_26000 [Gordonia crocea]
MPPGRGDGGGLLADSSALVLAAAVNGAVGVVFWVVAAQLLNVADIGRATTVLIAATTLGTLSNLSLGLLFERHLATAGRWGRAAILRGQAIAATLAVLLAGAYTFIAPDLLLPTPATGLGFLVVTAILGAFALQDSVLIGLLRARWTALKNIIHAVAKLVLLVVLAPLIDGATVVVVAWVAPAAVAVAAILVAVAVRHRTLVPLTAVHGNSVRPQRLVSESISLLGIVAASAVLPLAIPLVVLQRQGLVSAGHFGVAWTLVTAAVLVVTMVGAPFVARVAANPELLPGLWRRQLMIVTGVSVIVATVVGIGAPVILSGLGGEYSRSTRLMLILVAVSLLAAVPERIFVAIARVRRRLGYAVAVQVGISTGVIVISWLGLPHYGLPAVGFGLLICESLAACIVAVPLWRQVRAAESASKDPGTTRRRVATTAATPPQLGVAE